jgi:hypothetical protein
MIKFDILFTTSPAIITAALDGTAVIYLNRNTFVQNRQRTAAVPILRRIEKVNHSDPAFKRVNSGTNR